MEEHFGRERRREIGPEMAEGGGGLPENRGGERETDLSVSRVRETLREILMEIPGFQALTERGIPPSLLEGAQPATACGGTERLERESQSAPATAPGGSEGPETEAPAAAGTSENGKG